MLKVTDGKMSIEMDNGCYRFGTTVCHTMVNDFMSETLGQNTGYAFTPDFPGLGGWTDGVLVVPSVPEFFVRFTEWLKTKD